MGALDARVINAQGVPPLDLRSGPRRVRQGYDKRPINRLFPRIRGHAPAMSVLLPHVDEPAWRLLTLILWDLNGRHSGPAWQRNTRSPTVARWGPYITAGQPNYVIRFRFPSVVQAKST